MPRSSSPRRRAREAVRQMPDMAVQAGRLAPLTEAEASRIDGAVREILSEIGMSEAPAPVRTAVLAVGGRESAGRLCFPAALVDRALADLAGPLTLFGQNPGGQNPARDLELVPGKAHAGTGGASPTVLDLETGRFRASTLADLHDAARLTDALDHVQFFSRSLVAGDMPDVRALDLATALAALAGTSKHVMVSASEPEHVPEIAALCYELAGGEAAFRARPFLSMNVNHAVPPLRFHAESCAVIAECAAAGIPVHCNVFGQLAASSPVTLAGSVAQTLAEAIAGMIYAWLIDPGAKVICGPRAMVTDLRTGSMAGGGGEQALATVMTAQMAGRFGLANSTIAGATDAKVPDAQAGAEKAHSVSLALQAGAHLVTQAAGTQAGLMAGSLEALVIDNDMLGMIRRSMAPVEVNDETLALGAIRAVVAGEGHFLGRAETHARMSSDFLYPALYDRTSAEAWEEAGSPGLRARARTKARELLAGHWPGHADPEVIRHFEERIGIRIAHAV